MPNKAIPIEIKFDENVLKTAKSLGRIQGVVFTLLFLRACRAIVKANKELHESKEES